MLKQFLLKGAAVCSLAIFIAFGACFPVKAETLEVSAASAVVMTGDMGAVLFEKDAHVQRPMASTTKIMTALLTLEEAERRGDPVVDITQEMVQV